MSKKPYIVQQDSPNLVIVPTDSETYEPSSKIVQLASALPTPSQNYNSSVFAKQYSSKSNFNRVNNNVLIDVSKVQKPPTSWATNYLQSIGGSSAKYTRIYPSMPTSPSIGNSNQPENITDIAVTNTTIPHKTNTTTTEPIMEGKKSAPKINIDLIKPKPKPALQSTLTKEASQPNNNTKYHRSKIDTITSQAKVHKEPSLPKSYKIPMQSKNKPVIKPVMDKESIRPTSIKETTQKSQPIVPLSKSKDIYDLKQNKLATRETTSNKSTHPKRDKDPNQPKHELLKTIQSEINPEKTQKNTQGKTKKINIRQSNENHTNKLKYFEQIIPPKTNKGTEPNQFKPIRNKENSQPKYNKEIKQCKSADETALPRKHKDPIKSSKEITCLKTNKNISDLMNIKETSRIKNKQEPTFSTKLKTKKEHIKVKSNKISKISKHSESIQESKTKTHTDKTLANEDSNFPQALLEKEDIVSKLKKKRTTKKDSTEYSEGKNKKLKMSDANITKKEKAGAINEERLSKSISPIKSVVAKVKSDASNHNSDKRHHKESDYYHSRCENKPCTDSDYHCNNSQKSLHRGSDVDLRTKLKRKLPKNNYSKQDYKWEPCNKKNKFSTVAKGDPFVPEENLIISFNTKDDSEENVTMKKSPIKKLAREQSSGGNKYKKIKLEINIVFGGADTTDDEFIKSGDDTKDEPLDNMDLSFLDDFNVDEIVESLNECKDCSTKTSTSEDLPVADDTAQSLSSETQKIETTVMRQDNVLLNENEIKMETEVSKEISSIENLKDNDETELQLTVNNNRPCHREEIHSRIDLGISTIKEELDIVPTAELPQNEKSQETTACISSSEVAKVNSTLENTIHVHQKTHIPIDIDKPRVDITSKLQVSDSNSKITNNDKRSTTSQNNSAETVKKTPTNNDTLLVRKNKQLEKTEIIADTKEIKSRIVPSETLVANSSSTNIIHPGHKDLRKPLLQGNSKLENANNLPTPSINNNTLADKAEVTATGSVSTQKLNETSKCIKEESDIIIIDDSESEHETDLKDNQPVKDANTKDIQLSMESPLNSLDDVIIIENTESVIILDTEYKIEENDMTKTQPKQSENRISVEQKIEIKIDLDDTAKLDKTVIENTFVEMKSNTTEIKSESEKISIDDQINKETKSELAKTELQLGKDENADVSNNAKLANKPTSTTADEPSSKKPTETDTIVPEKSPPKEAIAIATKKQQNVNTQLETKAPNKSIPQENSENKNKVTKNKDKEDRNLVYNNFIEKAETKLFFFMGGKCTITDVIRIGKFSKIYLCKDFLKREYAFKALKTECDVRPRLKEHFLKEKMLINLQNGVPENNLNCVRLLKGFVICGICCFLMEYYPSNLQQAFAENNRSFHIDDVQVLSRQLVSAVTILRNNNIIHSDIKPSHILINAAQTRIKLCGFDQSCYMEHAVLLPNTGTVNYRAPELILGYPAGYAIDVWSTALVMYEMATNTKLFPGKFNNNILYQQLCTLGSIPMEMLMQSKYRSTHFRGTAFTRIMGSKGERVIIDKITFNGKIDSTLLQTYESEWGPERGQAGWRSDSAKLSALSQLLQRMLVMHPKYRIAIEFVFANPFIYESFDNHY